jgi:hypothetical protein
MRTICWLVVIIGVALGLAGCGDNDKQKYIKTFTGQLTQDGKPVTFPEGQDTSLLVVHEGGRFSVEVPIKPDGSFNIGKMPVGKYGLDLERSGAAAGGKGGPSRSKYRVPGGLTLEEGKTEYTVELGKDFKL